MSRRQSDDRLEQTERVSATKVETFERSIRTRGPILMGMVFALLFITFGFAWAGMAPLTKGATAFGRIIVETKAKKLQHQLGGTVERVLVREGQDVEGGQLLAVMETASLVASSRPCVTSSRQPDVSASCWARRSWSIALCSKSS